MLVAGLQLDIAWEDPEENFRRARLLAEAAAKDGARLLVLPEMFNTGFSMAGEKVSRHAEATRAFLSELAGSLNAWVIAGYPDPASPRPRNAASLYSPQGREAFRYHKIHPFSLAKEHEHYGAGDQLFTETIEGVRVTAAICYDLRFPELFRARASDTDLFVVIANWPEKRREAWCTLLRARAIENQCYVLGVNRVGAGGGLEYSGDSALLDPLGDTLATGACESTAFVGVVEASKVAEARKTFSFLADRRPDVYEKL